MKFLLTCSAWLEAIAKNEILKQWWTIAEVKDRLVFFEWDYETMMKVNLWSRVWNKIYMVLWESSRANDFDALYDLVSRIDWKKYISQNTPILVKATSIKSQLSSTPAIQKIVKKSIVDKLTNRSGKMLYEDQNKESFEVFTFFHEDVCYILANSSGDTLYKRGYKKDTWEAPIKESLAAGLVILSNWKYSDTFYDITCGSGTIAIEAVMFARNIAPGLQRKFAFENWDFINKTLFPALRKDAASKIFSKKYNVIASDIDPEMIELAKENARLAWVDDTITFEVKNFREYKKEKLSGMLISNPPYGIRLKDDDLRAFYKDLNMILDKNSDLKWGVITAYTDFDGIINFSKYKKRKLYNGNELCYFYMKK